MLALNINQSINQKHVYIINQAPSTWMVGVLWPRSYGSWIDICLMPITTNVVICMLACDEVYWTQYNVIKF